MLGGALVLLATSALLRRTMDATVATTLAVGTALASLAVALVQWFDVATHGAHVTIAAAVV